MMINLRSSTPIYEQIKEYYKQMIIGGVLKADEKVPSIRELSQTLAINPNTIQKAYKDLESDGYFYSVAGRGNFIAPVGFAKDAARMDEIKKEIFKFVSEISYLGIVKEEIMALVEDAYKHGKSE